MHAGRQWCAADCLTFSQFVRLGVLQDGLCVLPLLHQAMTVRTSHARLGAAAHHQEGVGRDPGNDVVRPLSEEHSAIGQVDHGDAYSP